MTSRRWLGPVAFLVAFLMVNAFVLVTPGPTGRVVKGWLDELPWSQANQDSSGGSVPSGEEGTRGGFREALHEAVDGAVEFYAFGRPDVLIQGSLRLTEASDRPGPWIGNRTLQLSWGPLDSSEVRYEIWYALERDGFERATLAGTFRAATALIVMPGDGEFTIWIRPRTDVVGHPTKLSPFRVDASAPPAPSMFDREDPPGYSFQLRWNRVTDLSGVSGYELQRCRVGGGCDSLGPFATNETLEDQVGSGQYQYRVRSINGGGVASAWSAPLMIVVRAGMQNPGPGSRDYGIHSNYTGFLHLWDLSDPSVYVELAEVPTDVSGQYLAAEPSIEVDNRTLEALVGSLVGEETNTLLIAETLFEFLYDRTDYDADKLNDPSVDLQRAGETLDRGKGICGDLAVLYITLLRIAGVPARPMHGYLDNPRDAIGGFHMWVEVYVGPNGHARPWMTVDVSGVTGDFEPKKLFPYFGIFNPDYLALGTERNYVRFEGGDWNSWARVEFHTPRNSPSPTIRAVTDVVDYESEKGNLFIDLETKRTRYVPCEAADAGSPSDPCPYEAQRNAPAGFDIYYGVKGVSKKRIDYGYDVMSDLPSCLRVELRFPMADTFGAITAGQSAIYRSYAPSASAIVQPPSLDGWITFLDGSEDPQECA